mmetsp:Transcript_23666/g.11399  ORF Transcript_23666/g.11399 Transcript_23666/m.11399 type:complete len:162 (+) Transcript_23666:409-894(+)|eukprot:CAMPEP_0201283238 /NCGR_PEP_ID=MMETSP1317-20130820/8013_1 /ASSEMBLY_ACC=CAM_ASM_000770 /TAXON_ID=187299 /ORGANISM="Undescribed Undescribed, Strain Undescribed" /LENGTH=161 /DNA_ID=CAMNT_0047598803 /DNA_START=405 /DNA_END=890 /DNA_ORIENTATION=-
MYIFTAVVDQVDLVGEKTGSAAIVVNTTYSDLVCVLQANATQVFSLDAVLLDTKGSYDPNLEDYSWQWRCERGDTGEDCLSYHTKQIIVPAEYEDAEFLVPYGSMVFDYDYIFTVTMQAGARFCIQTVTIDVTYENRGTSLIYDEHSGQEFSNNEIIIFSG